MWFLCAVWRVRGGGRVYVSLEAMRPRFAGIEGSSNASRRHHHHHPSTSYSTIPPPQPPHLHGNHSGQDAAPQPNLWYCAEGALCRLERMDAWVFLPSHCESCCCQRRQGGLRVSNPEMARTGRGGERRGGTRRGAKGQKGKVVKDTSNHKPKIAR